MKFKGGLIAAGGFFILMLAGFAFLLVQGDYSDTPPGPAGPAADPAPDIGAPTEIEASGMPNVDSENPKPVPVNVAGTLDAAPAQALPRANTPRPRGPGIVTGVVISQDDAAPVPGAQVVLRYREHIPDAPPEQANSHQWTSQSDAKGNFRFTDLPVVSGRNSVYVHMVVTAEKDGAGAVGVVGLNGDDSHGMLELVLRPSGGIAGQVIDETGGPIAGAIVTPYDMHGKSAPQIIYAATLQWSETDRDGRFRLDQLLEGQWELAVSSENFAHTISAPFATGASNAKIVMARGTSVSGIVVHADGGEPAPGVKLSLLSANSFRFLRQVESGEDGTFLAHALPDGHFAIHVEDETRVLAGASPRFSVTRAVPVNGVTVKVTEGASIFGTAKDAETGAPISGVRLRAWVEDVYYGRNLDATTDANGTYHITGIAPGRCTVNRMPKDGYASGGLDSRTVSLAFGQVLENFDFAMSRGVNVSGTVRDESGAPVAGVNVEARMARRDRESGRSAGDGAFTVRGLPPHTPVTIGISGRGYAAPQMPPVNTGDSGVADLEIVVEKGASVSGFVVDLSGKPATEAHVSVLPLGNGDISSESTGPEGAFTVRGLRPGAYRVEASTMTGAVKSEDSGQEITLAKGEAVTGIRLVLGGAPDSTITGRITNVRGEPLSGVSVNGNSFMGEGHAFAESDARGNYELAVESGLVYQIDVYHSDYSGHERDDVAAGSRDVDFVLEGRGAVEGQVVDAATGKPIAGFEIAHTSGFTSPSYFQAYDYVPYYDEAGRFTIHDVEAGEATIFVRATGYGPGYEQVAEVRPGEVTPGVQFRLKPGASIAGLVRDSKGTPVQGAQIHIASAADLWLIDVGGQEAVASSDAEGRFTVNSLGGELTAITAAHPDFSRTTVELNLEPGKTKQVEIVLAAGGTLEGTVTANGDPSANQNVFVHTESMTDLQTATTDASGFYTLSSITPGEVSVNASVTLGDATRSVGKTALVESGATTTVDFNVEFGAGAIEGTLLDGGVPVSEGYISAMHLDAAAGLAQNIDGTVSSGGAYRISGLDAGDYKVMVNVGVFGDGMEKMRTIDVSVQEGETVHLDIDLDAGARVRGMVDGISDAAMCIVLAFRGTHQIADFESAMATPEMQTHMAGSASVDTSGAYAITGLEAGDYTVLVFQIAQSGLEEATFTTGHVTLGESGAVELDLSLR